MKHMILIAAAAALGMAGLAVARPGNGNGHGHGNPHDWGAGGCPPGLAKKENGCLPPGQARKLGAGERWTQGYGTLYSYQRIPYDVRRRYGLNSRYRYYYEDGAIYVVDPRTMMIAQVINALLH
jgi:hypothetical protein